MKLTETQPVIIKKKAPKTMGDSEEDIIREYGTIFDIKPFRLENLKMTFYFPADAELPNKIRMWFFLKDFKGYNSCHKVFAFATPELNRNKTQKRIVEMSPCSGPGGGIPELRIIEHIGFFEADLPEDISFSVDVETKFTYQIHSTKFYEEFWFPDGLQHHQVGDNFTYREGKIELTVMDINEEYGIAFCSALGFIG